MPPSPPSQLKLWKVLAPAALVVALATGLFTLGRWGGRMAENADPAAGSGPMKTGDSLPDLSFSVFPEGEKRFSELGYRVTLINFWATWCTSCLTEMPSILRVRDQLKDEGFGVVLVSVDSEPARLLPKWLTKLGISFPVYVDRGEKLGALFDLHAIPTTVIVGKDRKILHLEAGDRDWASPSIVKQLREWLR